MKLRLISLLFLLSFSLFSQRTVQKYAQAKIYFSNADDLELLINNGVAVDHGAVKKNSYIESVFSEYEINKVKSLGFNVEVTIDDMQKHIEQGKVKSRYQNKNATCSNSSGATEYVTPTNFNLGSMGGFYTLDEMLQELDDMRTLYPNLITVKSTINNFSTVEGRSIHWVKISDNPDIDETEPEMLFTAIHHAREPAAMQQLIFYMWYLLENYATSVEVQSIVDNTEQFFVPIMNVDGYRYNQTTNPNGGGFWRKNRRNNGDGSFGVDPNRNYADHWGGAGTSDSFGETYPGTGPFSEVENQAIKWFTEQHEFIMAINNHTYSELLLFPFGWDYNQPTPENNLFEAISSLMVSQNGYTNEISSTLYPVGGDSDDWMYADTSTKNKIYAMTPEIGSSFWPNQGDIIPICKEMMFHNLTAAHLITNYAEIKDATNSFINATTGNFEYTIKRLGVQDPANFSVSIVPVSSNIVSVGTAISHNNMAMLQEDAGNISYVLENTIQSGDEIVYKLVMNNGQFDTEVLITKLYGNPQAIFTDNGNATTNYNTTNWGTTTSEFYSASSSITDSPSGNYNDNENSSIELSDSIDLTDVSIAQVSFYAKWNLETGWDYVQFEISIDGGNTWIPQCGNYSKNGTQNQGIEGQPMYDGNQSDWVLEEINLSDYIGEQIKFRFQLVSDGAQTRDGFYFDDFEIKTISNSNVSVTDNELLNVGIYPNPTTNVLHIDIPNLVEETKISVFSINGQLLKQIKTTTQQTDIDLSNFRKGIYFLSLQTSGFTKSFKIIKK